MYIDYVRQQGKLSEVLRQAPEKTGARETQWSGKANTRIRPNAWHLQDPISHGEEGTCNLLPIQWWWFAWVNALCNLLGKKSRVVAASLPGHFLSRHCFMLCITMEVEPRIVKQYKCDHCSSCKNYQGQGMKGGKKSFFASFLGWPEDRNFTEIFCFGASFSTSNKLLLVARHILTIGLQKCF